MPAPNPVLDVQGLTVRLPPGADRRHAVDNISFAVQPGEIVCVVGESGSGKSVTAHTVMGLLPPGEVVPTAGRILLQGADVLKKSPADLRRMRGDKMSMIFQEPMTALNPAVRIAEAPTTALDVTTQAQSLRLIKELQARRDTGVLFITHDFGVVAEIAHRVVVMQHGRVVEQGTTEDVLRRPRDEYTR